MKKAIVVFVSLLFFVAVFSIGVSAETHDVYTVAAADGEYVLSKYEGGTPSFVSSGSLSEIISELALAKGGSEIIFSAISTEESFEFPTGEFVLKGSLHLNFGASVSVPAGTIITLDGFNAVFSEGSSGIVRIKGGSVIMRDSCIFGALGGAVLLDYVPSSSLCLESGAITSASEAAAVCVESGSFAMLGGRIDNTSGVGVSSDSSVYLAASPVISGIGCDIETEKPITLAYNGSQYLGGAVLDVRYLAEFEKGTMTEVLYSASEASVSRINLTDRNGKSHALTCFSDSAYTDEKNFAAVYLPYTVKLFDGEFPIAEYKVLSGECLAEPNVTEKKGYSFSGWYADEAGREKFSFDTPIICDMALYSRYSLKTPSFKISSLSTVYDGKQHTLGFAELTHPLDGETGAFYTYEWYRDGIIVSRASELPFESVADSGVYECVISFSYSSDEVRVTAKNINLTVNKASVSLPEIASKYYTGKSLSPELYPSSYYTASDVTGTDAGEYPFVLTLVDSDNYRWESGEEKYVTVNFEILPANNFWNEEISIYDIYIGAEAAPRATAAFGEVYFMYSYSENGSYSIEVPTGVGRYFVKAYVESSGNYTALESFPVSFEIRADSVASLEILTMPESTVYRAFERFLASGLSLRAVYTSGMEETVGIDKLSIAYQSGDSFRYGDSAAIISYGGVSINLPVSVLRADYDISEIVLSDTSVVYDGKYHTSDTLLPDIVGKDGVRLEMTVLGGGTDVGRYEVFISFSSDSRNYNIPESKTVILTITPAEAIIVWDKLSFTYDGTAKLPGAYYIDVFGVVRYPGVLGAATDAGAEYKAYVSADNKNYSFKNFETMFEIKKADYDFSSVKWSTDRFVYDGGEKSVSLSGLPSGVSVIGYTDGTATEAGNYVATAALSYDMKNYNPPPVLAHEWRVLPAEYDLSGMDFSSAEAVYDGNTHYPTVSGAMPVGADGIIPEYHFSAGATHVSEGRVAVRVIFTTESRNYLAPADILLYVSIIPKGITVKWDVGSYIYNGTQQAPLATASESVINIIGAQENAGTYTATAVAVNSDYYVINSTQEFCIEKAVNEWTEFPEIFDIFASGRLSPKGMALSGTPTFRYYLDADCTREIEEPMSAGSYYMIAECAESTNYLTLISSPIAFTITEVIPVSMRAELLYAERRAFELLLPSDFACYILNNDGSEIRIESGAVGIVYENADSLRKKDSHVKLKYLDFELLLPITVQYANYDLSEVRWINIDSVYDGVAKFPILTGLPAGVAVLEYTGTAAINAGSYTAGAILSYDAENYNPPVIPDCAFTVSRRELGLPKLDALIYNGLPLTPEIDRTLYKAEASAEIKNAGEYRIRLSLVDSANYCFAGGEAQCEVSLTVLPKALSVSVSDLKVHLWESAGSAEYVLTDGAPVDGDSLDVIQYIEDGKVYLTSGNPNYVFNVTAGSVVNLSYPSARVMRLLLLWGLVILIAALLLAVIITQRVRIASAFASIRLGRSCNSSESVGLSNTEAESDAIAARDVTESEDNEEPESEEPLAEANDEEGLPELVEPMGVGMDMEHADELITDSLAKDLVKRTREVVYTNGRSKEIINVDTLSENFSAGDRVDVNILKKKSLVPYDTAYIKVLARGVIDKPISVYANDFSLSAVKMIALTGGEAIKVVTVKEKEGGEEKNHKNY